MNGRTKKYLRGLTFQLTEAVLGLFYLSRRRAFVARALKSSYKDDVELRGKSVLDSGPSCHMSGNKHLFSDLGAPGSDERIAFGDGSNLKVKGEGVVELGGLRLLNSLFVPGLEVNLLSVSKLEELGLTIIFQNSAGTVYRGRVVLMTFYKKNSIYVGPESVLARALNTVFTTRVIKNCTTAWDIPLPRCFVSYLEGSQS
eukprot:TRINITY_DN832_c0_g1_i4.p3 TRINITY_DN832_c0_g1~~TRINITY_DN832_c0_g1_i4.p3  ORF type:complete len:200 (+),score=34.30 TRINITY_DN832_c0_g1_i4:2808-3407(+)